MSTVMSPGWADHLTHEGALALARRIALFWADRGFPIRVEVTQSEGSFFFVRSDMRNGYPRGFFPEPEPEPAS